ncbi:hypothetical protein QWZ16_23765 [Vibrio ostreicida]|uniref:Uncharacterized protein n=1 Tax=Vibrio ostreicida TaxID=526588 RepID=A0ABT8BZM7_9VIBR|nr:hypothetical protein [Vibrio ostreicida]MDN3612617.1 hypothetical protein [Vibrio ostreicida]
MKNDCEEKYYKQAEDYKEKLSEMASQHNQLALMIQQYQYRIAEIDCEVSEYPSPENYK